MTRRIEVSRVDYLPESPWCVTWSDDPEDAAFFATKAEALAFTVEPRRLP